MPSVYAAWNGQCQDKTKRDELYLRICDLGELSHSFFKPPVAVKYFDQAIEGNILISGAHFLSPPSSPKLVKTGDTYYSLEKIELYGVEFSLFDARQIYPGENRISFVFCVDDDPDLNGIVVLVEDKQECLKYTEPVIKQSDYFLETPNIHLRYFFEKWLDHLLGWIKFNYIRNLRYWRYEDMWTNEEGLADFFGKYGKYEYYEILRTRLENEMESFTGANSQTSKQLTAVRRLPKDIDEY